MNNISATIICKSKNTATGDILTTFLLEYPRIIHAEVLTHRSFSRNTASSRAVPVGKMLGRLNEKSYTPEYWGKNQKGMAAVVEIEARNRASLCWERAKTWAIKAACNLKDLEVHKQTANRLTEPFQIIQCLVTATNFKNFYFLSRWTE